MNSDTPQLRVLSNDVVWQASATDKDGHQLTFTHAASERQFLVRQCERVDGKPQYFLCEMRPNGRLCVTNARAHIDHAWDDPRIEELERRLGPNALVPALRKIGIDPDTMVFWGNGFAVNSIYYDSLSDCTRAVHRVLAEGVRYCAFRELSSQERTALQHREAVPAVEYWHAQAAMVESAEHKGSGLFKGCHNMFGAPLSPDVRVSVLEFLNAPTQKRWLDVRSFVIAGHITLWQAWCAIDPAAPHSGQNGFPSSERLRQAIRQSVEDRKMQISKKLQEVGPQGLQTV